MDWVNIWEKGRGIEVCQEGKGRRTMYRILAIFVHLIIFIQTLILLFFNLWGINQIHFVEKGNPAGLLKILYGLQATPYLY